MSQQAPSHGKRQWRWLLAITVAVAALVVFLPPIILALWGPQLLDLALSTYLHTTVTVQDMTGGWWNGLKLRHLTVYKSASPEAPVLLQVEHLTVNRSLVPLLFSTKPVSLRLDGATFYLQIRQNSQSALSTFVTTLGTKASSSSNTTATSILSKRQVDLTVTHGRLYLGNDGPVYALEGSAASRSLVEAPVQWQFKISQAGGESITGNGQVYNLAGPRPLVGQAEVTVTYLDLAAINALVPATYGVRLQGQIQEAQVHLVLQEEKGLEIHADLDLHHFGVQNKATPADTGLEHVQVRLQGRWQEHRWTGETLTVEVPGGHLTLNEPAWLSVDEVAWRGRAAFTLQVDDMQPVTQALAGLLPAELHMLGHLQVAGRVEGAVSREPQQPWTARLAGLRADFEAQLARVQWDQEEIKELVTVLHLQEGMLTIAQAKAGVLGGTVELQGHLSLQEDTPSEELQWQMTGVSLPRLLGPPFRHFTISQGTGRIARYGEGYRLEGSLQIPDVELNPEAFGDRQLHLTHAALTCAVTLAISLKNLAIDTCDLQAAETQVSLHNGSLSLGSNPQLSGQVEGWLGGQLLSALAPEKPMQFSAPFHLQGQVTVPLTAEVWQRAQGHLTVSSKRFVLDDMAFTHLTGQIIKTTNQLDLKDLKAIRGKGWVQGSGSWHVVEPTSGSMQVQLQQVFLSLPVHQSGDEPYTVEGTVSGDLSLHTGKEGTQHLLAGQVHNLRLYQDPATPLQVTGARVQGTIGTDSDGTLWARQVNIQSNELNLTVQQGHWQAPSPDTPNFQVDATLDADGQWFTTLLSLYDVESLVLTDRIQITLSAAGRSDDLLKTTQGQGSVRAAGGSFYGQVFSLLDAAYEMTPRRLQITKGIIQANFKRTNGQPGTDLLSLGIRGDLRLIAEVDMAQQVVTISKLILEIPKLKIEGEFVVKGITDELRFEGKLVMQKFNPREVFTALGKLPPATRNKSVLAKAGLNLTLQGDTRHLTVQLKGYLDDTQIGGQINVADLSHPAIRFDLKLDEIDLDRYRPPDDESVSPSSIDAAIADLRESWRDLDLSGDLHIDKIKINNQHIEGLDVKVDWDPDF